MNKRKINNLKVSYGGIAKPLGENYFLMHGATHEQGGIGIGKDLEVENGEIVKVNPKSIKILSNAPIMNGISPAQFALDAPGLGILKERFNTGFKYQEAYKDKHNLNDDGTKKARFGKYKKQETSEQWQDSEGVKEEIHNMMYNARDPKALARDLQYYLDNVVSKNPNLTDYTRQMLTKELQHYIKYPYSSVIIYRDDFDRNKLVFNDSEGYIPVDDTKIVTLSNAGKSTGIELSTNMLDTLAYKGGIAGIPIERALGIPAQETGLGKFPGTTFLEPGDIVADDESARQHGVSSSAFIQRGGVNPTELMNNHYYYSNTADQSTIGAISRRFNVGHNTSGAGWTDANIRYDEVTPEIEQAFREGYWYSTKQRDKENILVDPIVQAFELDKTGRYNPGISNHNQLVQQRGEELMNSPEIIKWWEESGKDWYEKGLSESKKLGGEMKNKSNRRGISSTGERKRANLGIQKRIDAQLITNPYIPTGIPIEWTKLTPLKSTISNKFGDINALNANPKLTLDIPQFGITKQTPNYIKGEIKTPWGTKNIVTGKTSYDLAGIDGKRSLIKPQTPTETINSSEFGDVSIWKANPNLAGDIIQGSANIIGNLATGLVNRSMLKDLEYRPIPSLLQSTKLNTEFNITPQVREIKNTLNKYRQLIDKNTSSSQVALARNRHAYVDALENLLGINAQKENIENQLINQDRLNQQDIANQNITNYNDWLAGKYNFENTIREQQSENTVSAIQNSVQSLGDFITNQAQWRKDMMNIAALSAAYHNVTPERMAASGIYFPLYIKQQALKGNRRR